MKCPHCGKKIKSYRNPVPTIDIIIETGRGILLIERKNPPHGWALPGGFVDYGESLEHAALREAKEETGLDVEELTQFRAYSKPDRDPRQHTISMVFTGRSDGTPVSGDDATDVAVFTENNLPNLVFDHGDILNDYFREKRKKEQEKNQDSDCR